MKPGKLREEVRKMMEHKSTSEQKTTPETGVTPAVPQPNPDIGINPGETKQQAQQKATTSAHAATGSTPQDQTTAPTPDPSLAVPEPIDPSVQDLSPITNSDGLVDETKFKPYAEFGPHKVFLFEQHGMNYNFFGRCICGHQMRDYTLDEVQKAAQAHIAYWKGKTPA